VSKSSPRGSVIARSMNRPFPSPEPVNRQSRLCPTHGQPGVIPKCLEIVAFQVTCPRRLAAELKLLNFPGADPFVCRNSNFC
jgi:hypothetical protein